MRVAALASGSSGNAFLVQTDEVRVLVDAGVPLRSLIPALASQGLTPGGLDCILLTHEHSDHLASAAGLARRFAAPVVSTEGTLSRIQSRTVERQVVSPGDSLTLGDLRISTFSVPHDSADPIGYMFEDGDSRVTFATDLGHVPQELIGILRRSNLLILEANHDVTRLWYGPYPRPLKERVASANGHLSNDQTADCLAAVANGKPQWVWLAHLSETNNSPRRALQTVKRKLAETGIGTLEIQVALRDQPSLTWSAREMYFQSRLL